MKPIEIISQAQSILARYLPPDGITPDQCINELLALLDGPEAVQLTMKSVEVKPSLGYLRQMALDLCYLVEESGASPALTAISVKASDLHQAINAAMGEAEDSIITRLIQERDRVIADLATIKENLKAIKENVALSNERERQLSERLASIAALSTGS